MLIHAWFFLACLPVVSHVWGRVGQGKELPALLGLFPEFACPGTAQPFLLAGTALTGTFPEPGIIPGGCWALLSAGEAPKSLSQA